MISLKHKFIFIHIPKTGGESISSVLRKYSEDSVKFTRNIDGVEEGLHLESEYGAKHAPIKTFLDNWDKDKCGELDDYFKFGVVRNPWDRVLSLFFHYQQKIKRKSYNELYGTRWSARYFRRFIGDKMPTRLLSNWLFIDNNLAVDHVIRFGDMQSGFDIVCDKIGIPKESLPHANKTDHKPYWEYYNDNTRNIIAERYSEDIEKFGYKFGK